jgi:predicted heme/steroid binding protein
MQDPDRLVTHWELKRNTGERGTPVWIARHGIVYDVTQCPRWRTGFHEQLHFAGQDLTSELPDAPHGDEVFRHAGVRVVGRLRINDESV